MKNFPKIIIFLFLLAGNGVAYADIYRCGDDDGVVVLSNLDSSKKASNCTKMVFPKSVATKPGAPSNKADTPAAGTVQAPNLVRPPPSKDRLSERKRIISSEIDLESRRLEDIRKKLKELSSYPNILHRAKINNEIYSLKAQEATHLKNIDLLKIELSK
jgi:hypothetical protein